MTCPHAQPVGSVVRCAITGQKRPRAFCGECRSHWENDQPPTEMPAALGQLGLGDTIAAAAERIGIKPCGGCKRRRRWLNRLIPWV